MRVERTSGWPEIRSTATLRGMDSKAGRVIVLLLLAAFVGVMILPFLPS